MERPQAQIKSPEDEYDYELTQLQTDLLEFGHELHSLKENNRLTFVDFVLQGDENEMLAELEASPVADLLSRPHEQLAIPSDGSYYPELDLSKDKAEFLGMGLRVFGWKSEKTRYTNLATRKSGDPYEWKEYDGEDWTYEFNLGMSYECDDGHFSESLFMTVGSVQPDDMRISSQIFAHEYAETGYEGHGGHSTGDPTEEQVAWLADFIAKHLGDKPVTVGEYQRTQLNKLRQRVDEIGGDEGLVDKLVKYTWEAQALGILKTPRYQIGDKQGSIAHLLISENSKLNEIGVEGLREVVAGEKKRYKERKRYRKEHPDLFKGL